jgi:hypothetical protein
VLAGKPVFHAGVDDFEPYFLEESMPGRVGEEADDRTERPRRGRSSALERT